MKNRCNDDLRSQHRTARAKARKLDRSLNNTYMYFIQQCQTSDQRKLWSVINRVQRIMLALYSALDDYPSIRALWSIRKEQNEHYVRFERHNEFHSG